MLEDTYNFLSLTDALLSSGMPTPDQVADAARSGVEVVINLALPTSEKALPDEQALVESLGMQYIGIPVQWDRPSHQDLDDFMHAMHSHTDHRILVHCQANYRATGFITLYRVLRLAWKPEDALKDLRRIWNPDDYPVWREFINENMAASSG